MSPEDQMVVAINNYSAAITTLAEFIDIIVGIQIKYAVSDSAVSADASVNREAFIDRLGTKNRNKDEDGTIWFITDGMDFALYQGSRLTIKEYKALLMTMGFPP